MPHRHGDAVALLADELAIIEAEALLLAAGQFRRPLFPHEQAARVDFAATVAEVDTTAGRLSQRMTEARARIARELDDDLRLAVAHGYKGTPVGSEGAIGYLADLRNPAVRTTLGAGTTAELVTNLRDDLAGAVQAGYARALSEAAAQGIPLRDLPANADLAAVEADLDRSAIRLGRLPIERSIAAAGEVPYTQPVFHMTADEVISAGTSAVTGLSDAPDADAARQEAHKLHGAGRAQAADTLPTPASIYASELLDRNTCAACSLVDGRQYASIEAARLDYPEGRYRECEGGPRCRGTLVFVWPTEAPPTVDDTVEPPPSPAPQPDGTPPPADPAAADWKGRLGRIRAQRPAEWAPADTTPFDSAGWSAEFQRANGRRPTFDEHRQAEAAHNAARYDVAAQHEELVRQAGAVIREEADRRIAELAIDRAPVEAAKKALADVEAAYQQARNELRTIERARPAGSVTRSLDADVVEWRDRYNEAATRANDLATRIRELRPAAAQAEAELAAAPAAVYRDVLAEVQEMGATPGRAHRYADGSVKGKGTKVVDEMTDYLPRRWVDASIEHSEQVNPLYVGNIQRGHYRELDVRKTRGGRERISRLNTSGDRPDELRRVAIHELGHRIEHVLPEVKRLEHAFYRRRTMLPDGTQEARKWLGPGYGRQEVARPDKFADLYMGKDYGNGPASYYELLSMGNEGLFAGRYGGLVDDADMRDFILGLFTMV